VEVSGAEQIAFGLKVGVKTIGTDRKKAMRKPDVYSGAGRTKYALRESVTFLET